MSSSRLTRRYRRVLSQVERLREIAAQPEEELTTPAEAVSAWAVAQHLEHLAITGGQVADLLGSALDPGAGRYPGRPRVWGWVVLLSGWIPRGSARARPEWSPPEASPERARRGLAALAGKLEPLEEHLPAVAGLRGTLPHPLLGGFTPARWLRFLEVHQNHHLRIIGDIRRALIRRRPSSPEKAS